MQESTEGQVISAKAATQAKACAIKENAQVERQTESKWIPLPHQREWYMRTREREVTQLLGLAEASPKEVLSGLGFAG